jgi:small subunit ribosomal protein S17
MTDEPETEVPSDAVSSDTMPSDPEGSTSEAVPDDEPSVAVAPGEAHSQPGSSGEAATASPAARTNGRKVREGLVVSTAMTRTAVIAVVERVRHPRYAKTVQRTKRLYADDPEGDLRVGDRVRLAETRPLSKLKRWRVLEVVERAK